MHLLRDVPISISFLMGTAPEGVEVMTDIARYLDFAILIFLALGIAFKVFIFTIVLVILEGRESAGSASKASGTSLLAHS